MQLLIFRIFYNVERQTVCLNDEEKTEALMLSCDKTDVINFNWTFESVHANVAVGRRRHATGLGNPAGWYYEVQVMTQGIMQIGVSFIVIFLPIRRKTHCKLKNIM